MYRLFMLLCLTVVVLLVGCASPEGPVNRLEKANVLPLDLDDSYQIRKILKSVYDPTIPAPPTQSESLLFERARQTWGAIDSTEIAKRHGTYFSFFWRNAKRSDVTIRLEYRQAALGNYVMAQERSYTDVQGSHKSTFEVTGDEFLESGQVTSWRVLLIVNGRIVAFKQSFMWK